ncbi:AER018Cp [Eremothecium gossypii ATCC 10895]|uniref:AER018Cp n=1 Tax=Eremothecium gossypii (strain ATCC 10895 / CBS 109.51 / FGSC 9923 / NRRL Y-1056) TaxID=284811 RepID=Q757J5_EREGS|nr:AER018Cp [Eremothecium gossypii ATCC 10895]AAS52702.1 AER018Cp [Eremothecium gossypii ATCC 10895]AEY97007.1 FAER018Cp [Eremothecium gossypii FDAG1]
MLRRKYSKTLKLSLITVALGALFLVTNRWLPGEFPSVYTEYLQNRLPNLGSFGKQQHMEEQESQTRQMIEEGEMRSKPSELLEEEAARTEQAERKSQIFAFYQKVFELLAEHSPSGQISHKSGRQCQVSQVVLQGHLDDTSHWPLLTREHLSKCLKMTQKDKQMVSDKHMHYVDALSNLKLSKRAYSGAGIVTVGGGKFSMLALLLIKSLRKVGTSLPVEVLIPPGEEEEYDYCSKLLPEVGAKCIYLKDVLPPAVINNHYFEGYQLKSAAIIASSFKDLLLLDADNIPILNLDDIFQSKPYVEHGLVLWPDFWRRSTSPDYYEIARVQVDYNRRVRNHIDNLTPASVYTQNMKDLSSIPMHDMEGTLPDPSTESGQLLIDKERHLSTVLLSLYYNVNGETWYYPLFSQGAPGEGDKETFIAAANFYRKPYYQVRTSTGAEGYHTKKGFSGVAMLQHDFREDYRRYEAAREDVKTKYAKSQQYDPEYTVEGFYKKYFEDPNQPPVDVMFVHANLPKFEPLKMSEKQLLMENGSHFRSYSHLDKLHNYDIELESFRVLNEYLCVRKVQLKFYKDKLSRPAKWNSMCKYVEDRLKFLESTHEEALRKT